MKPFQIEKKQRLENSAIRLFLEKGVSETSVNDIVKDACLAKGTFYVYYKDKSALIHDITVRTNLALMNTLIIAAKQEHEKLSVAWSCAFLNRLILFFRDNPQLLKMLHHSFLLEDKIPLSFHTLQHNIECFDAFIASFQKGNESSEDAFKRFLLVMETSAVVCYNAIFYHQPDSLENISEMFYNLLTQGLSNEQGGVA